MSIYRTYIALSSALIILLFILLLSLFFLQQLQLEIEETGYRHYESYKLADELRQSSDDLTRIARLYVMTDELRYVDYFQEILAIRNGESARPVDYELIYWDLVFPEGVRPSQQGDVASLEERMIEMDLTSKELLKLNKAKSKSDKLAHLETTAFNAMKGNFRDQITDEFTMHADPDPELAKKIMFGKDYLLKKADIMQPINDFMKLISKRTKQDLDDQHEKSRLILHITLVICLLAFSLSILSILILRRKVLKPIRSISEYTAKLSKGDFSHELSIKNKNHDEIGQLASAFNHMVLNTRNTMQQLQTVNSQLEQQRVLLSQEKAQSERLLHNILPTTIADRLKEGESTIADEFPEVSVMFADIAGFTALSEKIGPHELVKLLNEIFGKFDLYLDKFGLEKIKTIGDCYMVVSGLPVAKADHATRIAEFALAVQSCFPLNNVGSVSDDSEKLNIRIGIHSGPAVAGVIGTKKLAYDLWGDVVNVASRMQTHGELNEIHVSEPFMIRLKDSYLFEERGETDVKGKGLMKTYSLVGRRYERL